jgi:hypothetical protein
VSPTVCRQVRPVDITVALAALPGTLFTDTGGTNGHIAQPGWLAPFVESLQLGGHTAYAVVRKLPAGQGIPPHVDRGAGVERRFHVPLLTHDHVTMRWPNERVEMHLEAGFLYEVRFDLLHEIVNVAPVDRVHVQVNTIGSTVEAMS